jgi:hypothetical protein
MEPNGAATLVGRAIMPVRNKLPANAQNPAQNVTLVNATMRATSRGLKPHDV